MTVLVSYDFSGQSDGTDIETYEPNFDKTFNSTAVGLISAAGRFYGDGAGVGICAYYLSSLSPPNDCVVVADVDILNFDSGGNTMGVWARITPGGNYNGYWFRCATVASDTVRFQLFKALNSSFTQLGSDYDATGVSNGASFNLRLKCQGDAISGIVDGVTRISVTDSTHSTGPAMLMSSPAVGQSITQGPQISTWSVEDLVEPTPLVRSLQTLGPGIYQPITNGFAS